MKLVDVRVSLLTKVLFKHVQKSKPNYYCHFIGDFDVFLCTYQTIPGTSEQAGNLHGRIRNDEG